MKQRKGKQCLRKRWRCCVYGQECIVSVTEWASGAAQNHTKNRERPHPHYAGEIWKCIFISKVRLPSTLLNPSRERLENAGKHFENGALWKQWGYNNHVISLRAESLPNTNPTWRVAFAFEISRRSMEQDVKHLTGFQRENAVFKCLWRGRCLLTQQLTSVFLVLVKMTVWEDPK